MTLSSSSVDLEECNRNKDKDSEAPDSPVDRGFFAPFQSDDEVVDSDYEPEQYSRQSNLNQSTDPVKSTDQYGSLSNLLGTLPQVGGFVSLENSSLTKLISGGAKKISLKVVLESDESDSEYQQDEVRDPFAASSPVQHVTPGHPTLASIPTAVPLYALPSSHSCETSWKQSDDIPKPTVVHPMVLFEEPECIVPDDISDLGAVQDNCHPLLVRSVGGFDNDSTYRDVWRPLDSPYIHSLKDPTPSSDSLVGHDDLHGHPVRGDDSLRECDGNIIDCTSDDGTVANCTSDTGGSSVFTSGGGKGCDDSSTQSVVIKKPKLLVKTNLFEKPPDDANFDSDETVTNFKGYSNGVVEKSVGNVRDFEVTMKTMIGCDWDEHGDSKHIQLSNKSSENNYKEDDKCGNVQEVFRIENGSESEKNVCSDQTEIEGDVAANNLGKDITVESNSESGSGSSSSDGSSSSSDSDSSEDSSDNDDGTDSDENEDVKDVPKYVATTTTNNREETDSKSVPTNITVGSVSNGSEQPLDSVNSPLSAPGETNSTGNTDVLTPAPPVGEGAQCIIHMNAAIMAPPKSPVPESVELSQETMEAVQFIINMNNGETPEVEPAEEPRSFVNPPIEMPPQSPGQLDTNNRKH